MKTASERTAEHYGFTDGFDKWDKTFRSQWTETERRFYESGYLAGEECRIRNNVTPASEFKSCLG